MDNKNSKDELVSFIISTFTATLILCVGLYAMFHTPTISSSPSSSCVKENYIVHDVEVLHTKGGRGNYEIITMGIYKNVIIINGPNFDSEPFTGTLKINGTQKINMIVVGGGGGGGSGYCYQKETNKGCNGGGGSGGAGAHVVEYAVSNQTLIDFSVGYGGYGGIRGFNGRRGGTSLIRSQNDGNELICSGGEGGKGLFGKINDNDDQVSKKVDYGHVVNTFKNLSSIFLTSKGSTIGRGGETTEGIMSPAPYGSMGFHMKGPGRMYEFSGGGGSGGRVASMAYGGQSATNERGGYGGILPGGRGQDCLTFGGGGGGGGTEMNMYTDYISEGGRGGPGFILIYF